MGTALQPPEGSHVNTGTGDCSVDGNTTFTAVAAATPIPLPLALNSAGAAAAIQTVPNACVLEPVWSVKVALPVAAPGGTSKLIWAGET